MTLESQIAVVTGAASGIGRAIALNLADAGAKVAAVDLDPIGAKETVASIEGTGGNAFAFETDLSDPASILRLRDDVAEQLGLPDVIVNAAGFDRVEPFLQNDDALWTGLVAVNYLGPVRLCHAFLTSIVEAEAKTKIINIASDAGRVGSMGETVYAGTKGALIAFTKSLAREMARHQINVTVCAPARRKPRSSRHFRRRSAPVSNARSRSGASARPRRWPPRSGSSRRRMPISSPARCSASLAA